MLSETEKSYSLGNKISIFEDQSNQLQVEDVMKLSKHFTPCSDPNINKGFSHSSFWIRMVVHNSTDKQQNLILSCLYPFIAHIDLYACRADSVLLVYRGGLNADSEKMPIINKHNVFPLNIEANQSLTYYMYLFNKGNTLDAPLKLGTYDKFLEEDNSSSLFYGLYFGGIFFIFLFNLFYYFVLDERINNYYTLYVVLTSFYVFNLSGLGSKILFSNNPDWIFIATALVVPLVNYCLLTFSATFLSLEKVSLRHYRFLVFVKKLNIFFLFLFIVVYLFDFEMLFVVSSISTLTTSFSFFFLMYIAVVAFKHKVEHSRYFIIAFAIAFMGLVTFMLKQLGVLPDIFITRHSLHFSFFIETLVFFFAFIHRLKTQRDAQERLLLSKNKRIFEQNEDLEYANAELQKLSVIAQETDNGIIVFNDKGKAVWKNSSFDKMHDLHNDILNAGIQRVYGNEASQNAFEKCVKDKLPCRFSSNRVVKDELLFIQTNLTPTIGQNGGVVSVIAIDSNITRLIQVQNELEESKNKAEQANKLKTAIMTNVSHELRTPLNAIIGFSDLLQTKQFEENRKLDFIRLINVNGKKLLEHIEGFLDVVKIETGDVSVFASRFDLNMLLRELYSYFKVLLDEMKKDEVELKFERLINGEFYVYSDREIVKQIYSNLISNALKFTNKGHVSFGYTLAKDKRISLYVKDTGIGLTEDKAQLALESFRQIDNSLTREFGGTGVGLTIVNGLVKLLKGDLHIIGREGEGTHVVVTLQSSDQTEENEA